MPISTINQNGLTNPLTSVAANTVTSAAATALTLQSAGTTAVTINTSQNVGIGTASPATKLQISESGAGPTINLNRLGDTSGNAVIRSTGSTGTINASITLGGGSDNLMTFATGTSNTERMRIDSSGNVGIGTTSPTTYGATTKLAVVSTGTAATWLVGGTSSGAYAYFSNNAQSSTANTMQIGQGWATGSDNIGFLNTNGANPLLFATNGAERMRIDSSGRLLVNLTGTLGGVINSYGNASSAAYYGKVFVNGDFVFGIQNQSGTVVGGIVANASTTSYNTSSDYRLKENIAPMTGALATVAQLKPVTYDWKAGGSSQGFIAHELQAVVPDCVTGEKDAIDNEGNPKYQGVDTSFLVATLTAAIQELKAEFDAYKASHP